MVVPSPSLFMVHAAMGPTEGRGGRVVLSQGRTDHAGDAEWLDYARGLGDADRRHALAAHVEAGCARCTASLRVWEAAVGAAARDRGYAPPDSLLRQAKGAFALSRPSTRRELAASLVFDSFLAPVAAGVRSASAGPRLLLYKAGRYEVRLRAESVPGAGRVSLVGQVVDEENPDAFLENMTVMVYDGQRSIDRTTTNRLGEFAFDFEGATPAYQIAIGVPDERFLTVALPITRAEATDLRRREAAQSKRGRR